MGESKKIRCFVAVEVPKELHAEFFDIQKKFDFCCKKTNVNSFHLTLSFLGEISNEDVPKVIAKLQDIKFKPFSISLNGTHYFLSRKIPTAFFVGVESNELAELQKLVSLKLSVFEEREYVPHLTLFRLKEIYDDKAFKDAVSSINYKKEFRVDEFYLFSSTLTPAGPIYNVLERFKL
jgi:RNA 2',3'-cyclic 3'-phosphodiesterase